MAVYNQEFKVTSQAGQVSYVDITGTVKNAVATSGIQSGIVTIVTAHTTCAILYEEYTHDVDEHGNEWLHLDLNDALEKILPPHTSAQTYRYPGPLHYAEVESWPDVDDWLPDGDCSLLWNCDAHLKATIIGASETFAVVDGQVAVGRTGYFYLADFDQTRERVRKYRVVVIGE